MAYENRGYRDRDQPPREYHKATCSDCGAECEVPFKPTQGRPVYCKDCYKKHAPPREERRGRY
ncbi:MAG: CxxC-x17-CxxC domain-containing protein [Candidatus Methanomethylophilaceae archaeon]|jgi:CxxC-x17-CxxC domain-containing protein|nr:hypothetical protein AOA81_06700 [Methanomassiliicoccales archaeon RumEn M2]MDD2532191.1 hypothetical protein [Candidatus Methanomethylophilaceae archaeon]MDI9379119.1 hypothetical protein [Candidatus Thermoplasmatota archaeon]MDD2779318.1 hypothetical protein [Candidatus Methanomethylophilaceae archaeon]MDD3127996.1 hypothetical protein [Candidatus Methanomethylophilaceae archaeon]